MHLSKKKVRPLPLALPHIVDINTVKKKKNIRIVRDKIKEKKKRLNVSCQWPREKESQLPGLRC